MKCLPLDVEEQEKSEMKAEPTIPLGFSMTISKNIQKL